MTNLADSRRDGTPIRTNNPILNQYADVTNFSTALPAQNQNEWDQWRQLFMPLPEVEIPPWPEPLDPNTYRLHRNLTGESVQHAQSRRLQKIREIEALQRGEHAAQKEQKEQRARLKALAEKYYGREVTPGEMQRLWFTAVDEAEAASLIGIESDPWDALEAMANSEEAPGFEKEQGPTTSTSTHTTINLTDPKTAKGIILSALRDVLGRRAFDEEIEQFTAALRAEEEANPTVTTTTTTRTPEGDSTSASNTTGGAPSPSAIADVWLDEELNAEIDAVRAGTEYFQVAQALASGVA